MTPDLAGWLQRQWYAPHPSPLLIPPSWLFRAAVALRRAAYRRGWRKSEKLSKPVIVVGNLTVGGVGKTPLTIWLVEYLASVGFKPGVVSRGYGGSHRGPPLPVHADSDPAVAGDEPVLIARRTGVPVYVCRRRAEAGRALLAATDCDLIVADDGLQHYGLSRDVEIAVIDGDRRFGNGACLPAGPLREPRERLAEADLIVSRGAEGVDEFCLTLELGDAVNLADETLKRPLTEFAGVEQLYAVAGIGYPERFFANLKAAGLSFRERPFPDHHPFCLRDLEFGPGAEVLMTEKDAVKCRGFACERFWYVPLRGRLPDAFGEKLAQLLKAKRNG